MTPLSVGWVGYYNASAGNRAEAEDCLKRLHELSTTTYVSAYSKALIHMALGHKDEALGLFETAYEERAPFLPGVGAHYVYDSLRAEPHFQALLKKMNLPSVVSRRG